MLDMFSQSCNIFAQCTKTTQTQKKLMWYTEIWAKNVYHRIRNITVKLCHTGLRFGQTNSCSAA